MRKVIAVEYLSLDGVMQAPGHPEEDRSGGFERGGWTFPYRSEHRRGMSALFETAGAFLFGRITYEIFAGYWPQVTDPGDIVARMLNGLPKYVASTTLGETTWNDTTVVSDDVPERVRFLKAQPGNDILVIGSGGLLQTLLQERLVDQYQLWIHPVVLGDGKRLFGPWAAGLPFHIMDSQVTAGGLVILNVLLQN